MEPGEWMREAEAIYGTVVGERRYLHENAETGFDLPKTVAFVKKELTDMGYRPVDCGRAGVVALADGKKPGKVFLLRADMDALPVREEADVGFAARNGNMHACGHDMHTAMLLGAARLLKRHETELCGSVKLMFQPAEELLEGAEDMVRAGALAHPEVDAALMLHVMPGTPFPTGTVIVSAPGVSAPAADYFEIRIQGKGCHGSMPNAGVDPLTVAAHILIHLQEIPARELAIGTRAMLTVGSVRGGSAKNVIPDTALMGGTVRAFDENTRAFLKERLVQIAKTTAETFRANAKVVFESGCPTLFNDGELSGSIRACMEELLGREKVFSAAELEEKSDGQQSKAGGSEDFAFVSHRVPSVMLAVAAGNGESGCPYPLHHPGVVFDERALVAGSAAYAYAAARWLTEHPPGEFCPDGA